MKEIINIYCDESCHLEHDWQPIMLQGALWCSKDRATELMIDIRKLKSAYNAIGELKWVKVSASRQEFYLSLTSWFLEQKDLFFRALIVHDKKILNHEAYNQGSHDVFYYKMYFSLLSKILSPDSQYNIYLDIKDTRSRIKIQELRHILCRDQYDFTSQMILRIQSIASRESELMQLADFLLGAVSYKNRGLNTNQTKTKVIQLLEKSLGYSLLESTPLWQKKFNLFHFYPRP
ncbi:MAG: DUF3800 domain-containing protein [Caldiserica bacterium]|jgi:hypothetical protein|nr:DUF3800 domain-containing protein [Caldisericota bacterium]